jgi:hypothetical protein
MLMPRGSPVVQVLVYVIGDTAYCLNVPWKSLREARAVYIKIPTSNLANGVEGDTDLERTYFRETHSRAK